MEITIKIKNVYGNETIYPVCDKSKIFAEMLGQKTLTRRDLQSISKLGFKISLEPQNFMVELSKNILNVA